MGILYFKMIAILVILAVGLFSGLLPLRFELSEKNRVFLSIGNSFAAGTFLYVSVLDIIEEEFSIPGNEWLKFLSIITGFLLMSTLALWS
jgi:zinc transporter ZupT